MSLYGMLRKKKMVELRNMAEIYGLGGVHSRITKDELIDLLMKEFTGDVLVEEDNNEPRMSVRVKRIKEMNK